MNRRDFLRTGSLGAVFFSTSGMYLLGESLQSGKKVLNTTRSALQIPVLEEVDVLVVGGSSAGVSAASAVARAGGKSFLITSEPYLGEDICGNMLFWEDQLGGEKNDLAKKIYTSDVLPTPMSVKRKLDDELIDNGVGFFYSCYVTDVLVDEGGKPSGIIMSNRNGQQAITAKVIVDASSMAVVARLAGKNFSEFTPGDIDMKFTVLGNDVKSNTAFSNVTTQSTPYILDDKEYKAHTYSASMPLKDFSFAELCKIEQKFIDLTWDPKQIDSTDQLLFASPISIESNKHFKKGIMSSDKVAIDAFIPKETKGLYVLSTNADVNEDCKEAFLNPILMMSIGEKIGETAYLEASVTTVSNSLSTIHNSDVNVEHEVLPTTDFLRPATIKAHISAQETALPVLGEYDVLVMGGGTAGAPAGIGAAREGAKTLVIEYLHGLGGIGTMGLIGSYYHGYREGFTAEIDKGVDDIGEGNPRNPEQAHSWVKDWKMEWFRQEIRKAGGEIWFGAIGCGALMDGNTVKGVVVATPQGKGIVLANTVIDSTGSADIAIAAGAKYKYTGKESVAVQGTGLPPVWGGRSYTNTDWTFVNDSDIYDIWRTFVTGKLKYPKAYDIGKIIQTRERRRIVGEYEVSVLDIYNKRVFPDSISYHLSSFDTHGFTIDRFFTARPPKGSHDDEIAHVPLRSLQPVGLDGILVTGLGASAHRDAMPVIRMQPCLQNQGYSVGIGAAWVAKESTTIRNLDLKKLQNKLVEIGNLPKETLTTADNYPPTPEKLQEAVNTLVNNNLDGLEIVFWMPKEVQPLLEKAYADAQSDEHKLIYARVLAFLGNQTGYDSLLQAVKETKEWDEGWNYRGMGQFGMSNSYFDSLIMVLGYSGKDEAIEAIAEKAELLTTESEFSHFRAVAEALQGNKSEHAAKILYDLLQIENMKGHAYVNIQVAREKVLPSHVDTVRRNESLKELFLATGLYRAGDKDGLGEEILKTYANDLRGHYARYAQAILDA